MTDVAAGDDFLSLLTFRSSLVGMRVDDARVAIAAAGYNVGAVTSPDGTTTSTTLYGSETVAGVYLSGLTDPCADVDPEAVTIYLGTGEIRGGFGTSSVTYVACPTAIALWTWSEGDGGTGFGNHWQTVAEQVIAGVMQPSFIMNNGLNNTEANYRSGNAGSYIPHEGATGKYLPCPPSGTVGVGADLAHRSASSPDPSPRELGVRFWRLDGSVIGQETFYADVGFGWITVSGSATVPADAVKFDIWVRGRADNVAATSGGTGGTTYYYLVTASGDPLVTPSGDFLTVEP